MIAAALAKQYPESNANSSVALLPFRDELVGDVRTALYVLFGAVACLLLIANANVANLMLARAVYRQKEIAVRTALGASRLRIVRQLLTESLLLSVVSGVVGFTLSFGLVRLLIAINPPWALEREVQIMLPELAAILSGNGCGTHRLDWLAGEA